MNKGTIKISVAAAALLMSTAVMAGGDIMEPLVDAGEPVEVIEWASKHNFFGFSQIGVRFADDTLAGDYKFEADRIRLGWKYTSGVVRGKVFLDFAKKGEDTGGIGVPDVIKDAFITYYGGKALAVKAGVIKTPVGMGFTIPGWNLDVIKRGFDKKLAFERDFGIMVSGRDIGFGDTGKVNGLEMGHEKAWKGFGYDIMIAGQAGRSGAVTDAKPGNGNAYMARVMYDWGDILHTEASYGISEEAGGEGTEDYKVMNFGLDSHFGRGNFKAEYYDTENVRGEADWDIRTLALTGTYYITDTLEAAVKYIGGSADKSGESADVSNTYIGLNYYINPKNNKMDRNSKRARNRHRIQLNYVLAGGDAGDADANIAAEFEKYASGAFFTQDAVLMQYQFKF